MSAATRETFVTVAAPGAAAAEPAVRPRRIAVIVAHGMGRQVRFETVDTVVIALRRAADPGGAKGLRATVRMADLGGELQPRAELVLDGREVHVYEAYWAPLTEGRVSLREVAGFLGAAGWNGLRMAWSKGGFERLMFGAWRAFRVGRWSTLGRFLAALLALVALFVLNTVTLALAGLGALGIRIPGTPGPRPAHAWNDAAWFGFALLVAGAGVGLGALAARRVRGAGAGRGRGRRAGVPATSRIGLGIAFAGVALAVAAAAISLADLWALTRGTPGVNERAADMVAVWPAGLRVTAAALAGIGALIAALAIVLGRWFLVQYVGDVAAYLSAHAVSRFEEIRRGIQKVSQDLARAVYDARLGAGFLYDEVALVGHSLGSVIAYDTLNAMLNEDLALGRGRRVAERTKLLLTVGSPLDKTAFIFRGQRPDPTDVREGLAAAKQPLIVDYRLRPERWINLYSRFDWIGGPLAYYDAPPPGGAGEDARRRWRERRVRNIEDRRAVTPLAAHNELLTTGLLGRTLYRKLTVVS